MMINYVGIQNPYQVGEYSIETNAKVMQRYRFIHEGLMRVAAGQLPSRENWDLKLGLCKHIYEDAEAASQFRARIPEMRSSSQALNKDPDATLSLLMDELVHAKNDLELVAGIYEVIKPALLNVYKHHMTKTQQIVDQPTIRIFRTIIWDLEEQIKWAQELMAELQKANSHPDPVEFKKKLQSYLDAAGGMDGLQEKSRDLPHRWRSHESYEIPLKSKRDPLNMGPTTLARTSVAKRPEDPVQRKLVDKMRVRQEEMTASELIAAVLFLQKNMPWDFYKDLARHIWDEARHAMFGQAALEADGYDWKSRPQYTSDYDVNAPKIPASQYAWLSIGIEEGAMISMAKKKEYEFCRDQAMHPLMEQFQDYDWADEIVHANLGRKWTPELLGEELKFVREVAKKELDHFWKEVSAANEKWNDKESK